MSERLCGELRHARCVPGIGPDSALAFIKLNTTPSAGGSLVSLLFVDDRPEPVYVTRRPRDLRSDGRLSANYQALDRLARIPSLEGRVPRPVWLGRLDRVNASVETCLQGTPLAAAVELADRGGDVAAAAAAMAPAVDLLWDLHSGSWCAEPVRLREASAGLLRSMAASGEVPASLGGQVVEALDRWLDLPACGAYTHGDANPNNMLVLPDGRAGMVDWEHARDGMALMEYLELFRTGWIDMPYLPEPRNERVNRLWDGADPMGTLFIAGLSRYAGKMGAPVDALRVAQGILVAQIVERRIKEFAGRPDPVRAAWLELLDRALRLGQG